MTKNVVALSLLVVTTTLMGATPSFAQYTVTTRFGDVVSNKITAKCEANTSVKKIPKRHTGNKVVWMFKKDENHPCDFKCEDVRLVFVDGAGIVQDDATNAASQYVGCHSNKAKATVVSSSNKTYKYMVQLKTLLAEDPELEVNGTMPEGGPKKGKK